MEVFNLPSHPNLGLLEDNVDVAFGGAISTAKNNCNLQLGFRLEF
jgi:hypothetical protein